MGRTAPDWLNKAAKKYFIKIARANPALSEGQRDIVALMSDQWETYQSAAAELQRHADNTGSLTVTGSTGNTVPHPAFKIQNNALAQYLKCQAQLRLSFGRQGPDEQTTEVMDKLDAILDLGADDN